ncbi:hypothetical protein AB4156_32290 [Cupriavidus sp. 2MCAB6]|uniref:hypothetical protein n=1 Tax=Cupriavidus sp. 2MCAB6 TaxID=3232981 RepID=UPI003F8EFD46
MKRGVSHAGINRFVKKYGAREMAWVRRDVACKFLQVPCKPGLLETKRETQAALMHSFSCSKLIAVQAQLIFGDPELNLVDKSMAEIYDQKIKNMLTRLGYERINEHGYEILATCVAIKPVYYEAIISASMN